MQKDVFLLLFPMKELYQKLRTFTGKSYGLYKSLSQRTWNFGDFDLEFLHVQGDSYAPPSRLRFRAPLEVLGFPKEWGNFPLKRLALADFLMRRLSEELAHRADAAEKGEYPVSVASPGQEIRVRNSFWVGGPSENDGRAVLEVILSVKLPGNHREVDVEGVCELVTSTLPDVLSTLYAGDKNVLAEAQKHIECLEIREELLKQIQGRGLVAFVPDGAVLPRESGLSDLPSRNAVPFKSPEDLRVTLTAGGRTFSGMGIPKGITVIAGGAYHGKSTLLDALEAAVYPHVPGDGREAVVIDPSAVRINAESGRSVRKTRIAPLVRELPYKVSTESFSTLSASGSTGEASNLVEAMEFGCRTVLIDEDSSAVNFLIRDARMRRLVGSAGEPLIPLVDRIRELAGLGVNMIIVAGACGDFLSVADTVIVMRDYIPENATARAKDICKETPPERLPEDHPPFALGESRHFLPYMQELMPLVKPTSSVERLVKVRLQGTRVQIGFLVAETGAIPMLNCTAERCGAGLLLLNLLQNAQDVPAKECIEKICGEVSNVGFRKIPQGFSRDVELPRPLEVAMLLLRLRSGK